MVVLILESVPESLRGQLSKWMLEPKAGVFVGRVSAAVRDLLWEKACREVDEGGATMIFTSDNEQGFSIRSYGDTSRRIVDWEGLQLVLRPHPHAHDLPAGPSRGGRDWDFMLHPNIWAKTPRFVQLAPEEPRWHPLIAHLIDVAMVAQVMWDSLLPKVLKEKIAAKLCCMNERDAGRWVAFFVGLHDLGKATPGFALKWDEGKERLLSEGFRPQVIISRFGADPRNHPPPHGFLSCSLIGNLLGALGVDKQSAIAVGFAVGGHHGVFPDKSSRERGPDHFGGNRWRAAQEDLVSVLAHVTGVDRLLPSFSGLHEDRAFLIWLAGLTSVADWIGSNHEFFTFAGDSISLPDYVERSKRAALRALERLGWFHRPEGVSFKSFADLVDRTPNALQRQVEEISLELDGPSIVLIEYPMGGGKTEAAFYLAHTLQANAGNQGLFMAMPSMATSNQMFDRTVAFLENCFPDAALNVQLLHGRADLNPNFDRLIVREVETATPLAVEMNDQERLAPVAGVLAAEWFTHRKHGLLAQHGIGTIDQALLGALNTKHYFVRLFGLAGKVVVFDEVHALDPYMRSLLVKLLGWLGAFGSSVILLSATLPSDVRDELLAAYMAGRGRRDLDVPEAAPYPRVSWMCERGAGSRYLAGAPTKTVHVRSFVTGGEDVSGEGKCGEEVSGDAAWIDALEAKLSGGGVVAVLCNTVGRAQEVYELLKERFRAEELVLFHARFPIEDRMRLEEQVLRYFGRNGAERPHRMICVATQVIEQSLDLDFDLMVTELAPIELLLQRSGRVWRHDRPERPEQFARPELWILLPGTEDGVPEFRTSDTHIYEAHALLRTYLCVTKLTRIEIPGDVDNLIGAVYSHAEPPPGLSAALTEYWRTTASDLERETVKAKTEAVRREAPGIDADLLDYYKPEFDDESEEVHMAYQAMTRLGGPTVEVVCLYRYEDGRVFLDCAGERLVDMDRKPSAETVRALLGRSMRLSFHPQMVKEILAIPPPDVWDVTVHLRRHRALYFAPDGACVTGGLPLKLDPILGLVYVRKEGDE